METSAVTSTTQQNAENTSRTAAALTGDDFLKLLVTQLSNQDPLEPTSPQELMDQIAGIRDIELSTQLTESLQSLTEQQRYGSASGLIGNYVVGRPDADDPSGARPEGMVVGVRFADDGRAYLQMENGLEVSLDEVEIVVSPEKAAAALVGKMVSGIDASDPADPRLIEGIVTAVRTDSDGSIVLELDTGEKLGLKNVINASDSSSLVGDGTSLG